MVQDVKLHKKKITEAAINFIAKTLRPLKAIEGQGLIGSNTIHVSAQYSHVCAEDILPSRIT